MMKQSTNLNAELREWLSVRLVDVLGTEQTNIRHLRMNIHEAKKDIVRLVYDYQLHRQWGSIAKHTAEVTGYDESSIRKLQKCKKRIK